jgi:hypothetical protein
MEQSEIEELIDRDEIDVVVYAEEREEGGWMPFEFQYVLRATGEILVSRPPSETS